MRMMEEAYLSERLQEEEKGFSYSGLSVLDALYHVSDLATRLYAMQNPEEENAAGTLAVLLRYLDHLGFRVEPEWAADHEDYGEKALAAAKAGRKEYLEKYLRGLMLGRTEVLNPEEIFVKKEKAPAARKAPKRKAPAATENGIAVAIPLEILTTKCPDCTLEEIVILHAISGNPSITQKELTSIIRRSERTVKTKTILLQQRGYLRRVNGKRNGRWELQRDLF